LDFWYHALEVYSGQHLTKPEKDRIMALSGLAKEVGPTLAAQIDPQNEIAVMQNSFEIITDDKHHQVQQADYEIEVIRKGDPEQAFQPGYVMDVLKQRPWPGNIRELQNVIERAVVSTSGRALRLPNADPQTRPSVTVLTLADAERAHILAALRETNGVVGGWNGAAARLGVSRTTLIAKMQRLGLAKESSTQHTRRSRTSPSPAGDHQSVLGGLDSERTGRLN